MTNTSKDRELVMIVINIAKDIEAKGENDRKRRVKGRTKCQLILHSNLLKKKTTYLSIQSNFFPYGVFKLITNPPCMERYG